jgi:hypothetical protein
MGNLSQQVALQLVLTDQQSQGAVSTIILNSAGHLEQ